jgi:hypothetical protein
MTQRRTHNSDPMITTTRLAAAGVGLVALAGVVHGVHTAHKAAKQDIEISNHINDPNSIPMTERVDIAVHRGSGSASTLSHELAPNSKKDQASLYGEIMNQMHDGVLQGEVHVDKRLVHAHPSDVNFIDPTTGAVIKTNKH